MKDTARMRQVNLVLAPFDLKKAKIFEEALDLMASEPEILARIAADQDARGLDKKKLRNADAQWHVEREVPALFDFSVTDCGPVGSLEIGRPRMRPEAVYLFLIARGLYGSPTREDAWERTSDSGTFRYFVDPYVANFPGRTTVLEQLNSLSEDTRDFIFRRQLARALELEFDDFDTVFIDSTHVHSRSAWPTDSGLILKLLNRAYSLGQKLDKFGLPNFRDWSCPRWLKELQSLDFAINVGLKKKDRGFRRTYGKFLKKAEKMAIRLSKEYDELDDLASEADLPPSRRGMLDALWGLLLETLSEAFVLGEVAYRRVVLGEKVEREEFEKIFSASDRSAAFIEKGGREKVFGYRPQFCRSRNGLITSVIVPEGNAADSAMLFPVVKDHVDKTGTVPASVSTDDGYASFEGRTAVQELGVKHVSINGGKGKALTPEEDWDSDLFADLRNDRSAVESLMFTGKHKFGFGQFHRCGIDAVRAEMLEKAIAHNFWRIAREREKRRRHALPKAC